MLALSKTRSCMVKLTWLKQAFRKFVVSPLSTGLFIFIVLCASLLFLVLFSTNDSMYEALFYKNRKRYANTDLVIELGNNYEQRFFWLQPLNDLNSRFEYAVPILKYPALSKDGRNVLIHFTEVDEYRKIAYLPDSPISYQEVYVIGDWISEDSFIQIPVKTGTIDLEIKGTVKPSQINLDAKQPIMVADIGLAKQLLGINVDNMYNEVYIKLKNGVDKERTRKDIQARFPRQAVRMTDNLDLIAQSAQQFSVSIRLIASLTIIPLTLVILLLARINFKKNEQDMLILHLLGATRSQCFVYFFSEYLLALLIGFGLAIPLWIWVTKLMVGYLSGSYLFLSADPFRHLILSFLGLLLYLLGLFLFSFLKLLKASYHTARTDLALKYEKKPSNKQFWFMFGATFVSGTAWLGLKYILFPKMPITLANHLWKGLSGMMIGIVFSALLLKILSLSVYRLLPKDKRFTVIEGRDLAFHKLKYWFMFMTLFAIITLAYAFFANGALKSRAERIGDRFNCNIVLNNITINHGEYDFLMTGYPEIEWYEKGFTFYKVLVSEYRIVVPLVVSVNPDSLSRFLDCEITPETLALMKDQRRLAIMLSQEFQTVYGLKSGDTVNLDVNQDGSAVEYIVAGFIPEEMDVYAITNFYGNDNTVSTHEFNSLFVKGYDPNYLVRSLASKLSPEGVSVASKDALFTSLTTGVLDNQKFIKLFIAIVSICLLLMLISIYGFIYMDKIPYYRLLNVLGDIPTYPETVKKALLVNSLLFAMSWISLWVVDDSILALTRYAKTEFGLQGINAYLWLVYLEVSLIIFALDSLEHLMKKTAIRSVRSV